MADERPMSSYLALLRASSLAGTTQPPRTVPLWEDELATSPSTPPAKPCMGLALLTHLPAVLDNMSRVGITFQSYLSSYHPWEVNQCCLFEDGVNETGCLPGAGQNLRKKMLYLEARQGASMSPDEVTDRLSVFVATGG